MKHVCKIRYAYGRRDKFHDIYYDEIARIYYCEGIQGHVKVYYMLKYDYTRYVFESQTRRGWMTSSGPPSLEEIARIFKSKCPDSIDILYTKTPGQTGNTGTESN